MSLLSYIEKLRTMPLKERRQIANTWTVVIVGIIFFAWAALTLGNLGSFGSPAPSPTPSATGSPNPGITPPY
jgi:hypothetical protein